MIMSMIMKVILNGQRPNYSLLLLSALSLLSNITNLTNIQEVWLHHITVQIHTLESWNIFNTESRTKFQFFFWSICSFVNKLVQREDVFFIVADCYFDSCRKLLAIKTTRSQLIDGWGPLLDCLSIIIKKN